MRKLYLDRRDLSKVAFKNPWIFLKYYFDEGRPGTYTDEKLTLPQCSYHKSRSFVDLCRLVQTYFPTTTTQKFAHIFIEFKKQYGTIATEESIMKGISLLYCDDVEAVVVSNTSLNYWYDWDEDVERLNISILDIAKLQKETRYPFLKDNISYEGIFNPYDDCSKYNRGGKYSFNNICKLANKYVDKVGIDKATKLINKYKEDYEKFRINTRT